MTKRSNFVRILLILIVAALLAACSAPISPTVQPPASTASSRPVPQNTPAPTATAAAKPLEIGVSPADINLDGQGLVDDWQAVLAPPAPFDNMHAPGPSGLPAHIQILFNGLNDPKKRAPGAAVIYIIPVDAYRQLWEQHDSRIISDEIQKIAKLSLHLPQPAPVRGLPVLPIEETFGVNDLATQLRLGASQDVSASKNGFRFVGRFAMDAKPLTNQDLRYSYQGFSNDGRFLITFFFPVRTDALPDDDAAVTQEDKDAFNSDGLGYLANKASTLDKLDPAAWEPDLAALDALIASLQITSMPATALTSGKWQWIGQSGGTNGVENPEDYALSFNDDGTVSIKADCNSIQGAFSAEGGLSGTLSIQLGPSTLAECGPDSDSNAFMADMNAVQGFAVTPSAHTMQLFLNDSEKTMIFSNVGD